MSHSGVASAAAPGRTPAAQAALRLIQSGQPIAAHFIGICGAGMSGIAKVFLQQGHTVTGSDLARSGAAAELEALGAVVHIGHAAKHLGRPHVVVFTGAIPSGNPEYLRAQQEGLPVLHRSQALALLLCNRTAVAVSGSHGKTTSTAMVAVALRHLGADPSFVNGGVVMDVGSSAASGSGRMFVIEADESDKSFLNYPVDVAFITNVDFDHPDFFSGRDAYEDAFVEFATAARDAVVICLDDPGGGGSAPVAASAAVCFAGQEHKVRLRVPGRHNAYNAVGALAVLTALGFPIAAALEALTAFSGTQRRFEFKGEARGVRVYSDYAHHPTEVRCTLQAARAVAGAGHVLAILEPHMHCRTRVFAEAFAESLGDSDYAFVKDIFASRGTPEEGVDSSTITSRSRFPDQVRACCGWHEAFEQGVPLLREGDVVVLMSAGPEPPAPALLSALKLSGSIETSEESGQTLHS
eukprot:CAMPEP_0174343696 /NCGR_PEP_ID=MMETSP0810-20121108/27166_1 /TAXON_ID=73025 ORGANISM="Eutreptiella gymnastica-like, Strain CCMP1594" /NCGR_SAMPLE_ID=MMETSP0810 /ASSEMBLY_ACC=CAM_ASM_000659 /LENGTH=466 /DNA_ID=CAMNT_0015466583 /DNA_START=112 /DNA_END=1513 /DNA_ORIENTATION=-